MRTYICMVCGFDYQEQAGDPARGIAPGTKWSDVPEDWVCPICGADKSMFEEQGGQPANAAETTNPANQPQGSSKPQAQDNAENLRLSTLFSNLARGCEKQYLPQESALFGQIAAHFASLATPEGDLPALSDLIKKDTAMYYPAALDAANQAGDRGALRALKWHEKVTGIQQTILSRYQSQGEQGFLDRKIFVCEACGFIFTGDAPPAICPVCKVPSFKFDEIKRGA